MEIINAAPQFDASIAHQCGEEDLVVNNPAVNHGDFTEVEDELKEAQRKLNFPPEVPEIKVNGVEISEQQVLAEMQYHSAQSKRESMVKAAQYLIVNELVKQQALAKGVYKKTEIENVNEHEMVQRLVSFEHQTPAASENECLRFYQQNKIKFRTSPLLEVRHILLASPPENVSERIQIKEIAQQLVIQLKKGEISFDDAVQRHSACPSKSTKGSLGQVSQGQTAPEFERQLFKANTGLINYPIESRYGFHIVYVDRKIAGSDLPFDYVKQRICDYLNEKVERKTIAQYIQNLINDAEIVGFNFDFDRSPLMQ
ncbi:peptidylprolyl isomerase [Thalassotalea marina]|uniref:peptidylprolyl isomerase n=1 Tax=Thalassotalea marina TaxID=1673741 RepID=A0A919BI68_9GAMM|nr:peptidylprolyl isomerase [Thalassotalea marina]GHF91985.1 peptidylprolyl isomerase [Thalassotalea marina]